MSDDVREALADAISPITVGHGYYSTSIGITAALEVADAILAEFDVTPKGETRVTDELMERTREGIAWYESRGAKPHWPSYPMYECLVALEAALSDHADGSGA